MDKEILKIAKKKVEKKKGFYSHLAAFIAVGTFFFAMNMVTSGNNPRLWFFFPMLPWGIGLMIHYFTTFGLPWNGALSTEWEASELEKEIERARRDKEAMLLPPPDQDEDFLDLNRPKRQKEEVPKWDKEDLV